MLQGERGKKRLAFLLKQAEVFQHFAPAAADQGKKCVAPLDTRVLGDSPMHGPLLP